MVRKDKRYRPGASLPQHLTSLPGEEYVPQRVPPGRTKRVSNTDEPDKKPPPQPTVAWDPSEIPELTESSSAAPQPPKESTAPNSAATQPMTPLEPEDAGATIKLSDEDVKRLVEEDAAAVEEAQQEEDRLIGTLVRDKWKVLKRLGAGSFGTVYKVQDVKGGWIEALKILGVDRLTGAEAEEMRARFLREAQIMKRLGKDSKHIVGLSTYEEDIEAGMVYFLMEFVDGRSLADVIADEGPMPVDRTIRLALQACDGLMAAHEGPEPVVHRDLKLENLMLTKDRAGEDSVKILDFGIAKIAEKEADSRLTTVGTLGTPGYAAPEQLRAETVDGRTDLFAFGVILYALLTGKDPWLGNLAHVPTNQIYELMVATERANVRPMDQQGPTIPPAMINVVMKLLRRDPAERFQSARELRDTLISISQGGEFAAPAGAAATAGLDVPSAQPPAQAQRAHPAPRPSKKKSTPGRLVAAAIVLAAASATVWAQPWGRTLDSDRLLSMIQSGSVANVWITEDGAEGGVQLLPVAALADVQTPFLLPLDEAEIPSLVQRLRDAGAAVDVSWEVRRLTDLAVTAQTDHRYFGSEGSDVRSYALRLAELEPESQEASALLLKVGERMAWDAAAAQADGSPDDARELIDDCLALVPQHPRCVEVSGAL